jgi:cellulose synthase (UDP-forming)
LAGQVLGTFQSFKILPTVLMTLIKPFGHAFKVTPKGKDARRAAYEPRIFWVSASMIVLTTGGLVINTSPEWHIVTQSGLLPMVAIWSAINIVVLFLVCMMSLQAPAKRSEERFKLDEPVWIIAANGALSTGRARDVSLSGAAIEADVQRALVTKLGDQVRVFIPEVGFVKANVVRQSDRFVAVQFDPQPSMERDLLISKLFTLGLDSTNIQATSGTVTVAMLRSIMSSHVDTPKSGRNEQDDEPAPIFKKSPAISMIVRPTAQTRRLIDVGAERRSFAA